MPQATTNHTLIRPRGLGQQGVYRAAHRSQTLPWSLSTTTQEGHLKSFHGTLTWLFAGQRTALPFSTMALRARKRVQSAVHFLKYKSSNLLQKLQAKGRKKSQARQKT